MGVYKFHIEPFLLGFLPQRLVLDGVSQFAILPTTSGYELTQGLTVHLDFTPHEATGDILGLRTSASGADTGWGIRLESSRYVFTKYGVVNAQTAALPAVGTREVLTFVYQTDGSLRVFRNFAFLAAYSTSTTYKSPIATNAMFGNRQTSGSALAADFYEAAFFAGALSDGEVAALGDSRTAAFSRLIGRGGQWTDLSRGINATLLNGAQVI